MKRLLTVSNQEWGDETLSIVEVDHFLHRVDAVEWSLALNAGNGSIELPALKIGSQNFYQILEKKHLFILWDNESIPLVLDKSYFRKIYPVMNGAGDNDEMDILNFDCLINRYLKGEPIVSKEEERVLCDYFIFANSLELGDMRMCNLDKGLVDA